MDESLCPAPLRKARIEIIPLIDVIFFLLATFVLFTLSLDKIRALQVQLPVPGPPTEAESTVFIQASEAGMFYWKLGRSGPSELISAAELRPRLESYKRSVPVPRVLVRGDGHSKFGAAVMVLDEVRQTGIAQVSVETLPSASGK
jgi:biopolymer transport protein ExbD